MDEIIKSNVKKIRRFVTSRLMFGAVLAVCFFNVFATRVLPKDVFLVYAADINVSELVNYANAERSARGLNTLSVDSRLVSAAYAKGQDMLEKDYWAHYGPSGESPWMFISQAGYEYVYAGENLAKDFSSSAPIHSAWMASPTHRDNIVNPNYKNIGIASVTGEFQGQETTIVVQMFGSLEQSQTVLPAESSLPITGEETVQTSDQAVTPPVITDPSDGDILKEAAFIVRGICENASQVRIYDGEEVKGDVKPDSGGFQFDPKKPYSEGEHILSAAAIVNGKVVSNSSNKVNVTVDTIAPEIDRDSARIEYFEVTDQGKLYHFTVKVFDNPSVVSGKTADKELLFSFLNEEWRAGIDIDPQAIQPFTVYASDKAGNTSEIMFSSDEISQMVEELNSGQELSLKSQKWFFDDIWERVFTRTLRGQVNFFITLAMIVILVAEQIMLAKTGLTRRAANNYLHIPVFIILLFASLLGGGGEIL
ncbi:MAG: CAP domain-containing protein [Candidatus Dojkabacteria bacterium]|jgi:hypothetical protein|nr:CAP domain-containing protein [Candidatus Dojkabacteria bacterium]